MKDERKNIISLIINIAIVVITFFAISQFFIGRGDANMQISGIRSLRYFTNLSNILAALGSLVCIVFNIMNIRYGSNTFPKAVYILKFAGTISVTLTFLTCVFFLGPINIPILAPYGVPAWRAYIFIFFGNAFYLHLITPILAIISCIFFEKTNSFEKKDSYLGIIPFILYAIAYIIMVAVVGVERGGWPDFYHFTFGGRMYLAPVSALVMFFATYLITKVEWKMYKKVNK